VRLNGVTVGNVLRVELSPDPADQRVRVIYEVDRKIAKASYFGEDDGKPDRG